MGQDTLAIYLHIPFCSRKCPYCDFTTYAVKSFPEEAYVDALLSELRYSSRKSELSGKCVQTIFFGGGTPSLLSADSLERLLDGLRSHYAIAEDPEITVECNPNDLSRLKLEGFLRAGVGRLSIGAQSFQPHILRLLGRDHTAEDVKRAVGESREIGIKNISLDLIYGVPEQRLSDLELDLDEVERLELPHLSAYILSFEPGTPLYQSLGRGVVFEPEEDLVAEMFYLLSLRTAAMGLQRYEISNFSRSGYRSKHNCVYWQVGDYLGVGVGAHSHLQGQRWANTASVDEYIVMSKGEEFRPAWSEVVTFEQRVFEFLYLGLRRSEGVSVSQFFARFGSSIDGYIGRSVSTLEAEGFFVVDEERIRFTERGMLLSNSVFEGLLGELQEVIAGTSNEESTSLLKSHLPSPTRKAAPQANRSG